MANAFWLESEGPLKGKVCFELKLHGRDVRKMPGECWYPLPVFLHWLEHNCGYKPGEGREQADRSLNDGCLPDF